MAAPKGHKRWGGRQLGTPNQKTEQWEKFSEWMMTTGLERFQNEMAALEGKDFILTVKDLMEFFKPKLARTELKHEGEVGVTGISITKLENKK